MMQDKLIKSLDVYAQNSKVINEIFRVTAIELEDLELQNAENYDELFLDTATKTLEIYARDLNLTIGGNLTLQQQRELITAHYRASFEQTTEETIKIIINAFSAESDIKETSIAGVYDVLVEAHEGTSDNIKNIQTTLKNVVPAHLAFNYGTQTVTSLNYGSYSNAGIITTIYPREV